jgi:hypothetical protein
VTTPADVNGKLIYGSATYGRIPGGFIVTWADTTEQVETADTVRTMARELSEASASLTDAGWELAATAGRTAEQAGGLARLQRDGGEHPPGPARWARASRWSTMALISNGMREVAQSVQMSATAADTVLAAAASLRDQATRLSQLTLSVAT